MRGEEGEEAEVEAEVEAEGKVKSAHSYKSRGNFSITNWLPQ